MDAFLSITHWWFVLALVVTLGIELALCRGALDRPAVERLTLADGLYGLSSGLVLVAGTARVVFGAKGWVFYVGNPVFWIKIGLLLVIFVNTFFEFTWALRQFNFAIMLVVASPDRDIYRDSPDPEAMRRDFAERAGGVVALAAESFNDGLRAYYFAFAAVLWFISPWMFLAGTGAVLVVLFRREFHSEALALMRS